MLFSPSLAMAEDPAPPDAATVKKMLTLLAEGNSSYEAGNFESAAKYYGEAYGLLPEPSILVRMADTYEGWGKPRKAIVFLQVYMGKADEAESKVAQERIAKLQLELPPMVTINSTPEGASVYLNSLGTASLGKTPIEVDVPEGKTTVYVQLGGFRVGEDTVDLQKAETGTLNFALEEVGSQRPIANGDGDDSDAVKLSTVGWISAGVGGALLVTGGLFHAHSFSQADEANAYNKRAPSASRDELSDLISSSDSSHSTAVAMYALGGLLAAGGVTAAILFAEDDEVAPAAPAPEEEAVSWKFSFGQDSVFFGANGSF